MAQMDISPNSTSPQQKKNWSSESILLNKVSNEFLIKDRCDNL